MTAAPPEPIPFSPAERAGRRRLRELLDAVTTDSPDLDLEATLRRMLEDDEERTEPGLHDLIIQRLFAAGLSLQGAASAAPDDVARRRIADAAAELDTVIRTIRIAVFDAWTPATVAAS